MPEGKRAKVIEDPTAYRAILRAAQRLWSEGEVLILPHAEDEMMEEGIQIQDVKNTIFRGRIRSHELVVDVYRHRVKGKTLDGEAAECVVEIGGRLVIVTVFLVKK